MSRAAKGCDALFTNTSLPKTLSSNTSQNMDLSPFIDNPMVDKTFESVIPPVALQEECIAGIDEAGRGPVLGPMVYGLAFFPLSQESLLKKLDFADSKTLTEEKREEIFEKIGKNEYKKIGYLATVLSPVTI
ncbi:unnamed protein product, partial [Medioppia subpectinata]